jgi:hypothetical protein
MSDNLKPELCGLKKDSAYRKGYFLPFETTRAGVQIK